MAGFLVDSTVHIHWGRGSLVAQAWLDEHAADELYTSVISIAEVYVGVPPGDYERWRNHLDLFIEVPVDSETALISGGLRFRLARQGRQLQLADGLIAAQALMNDWTIATANVSDFAPTGVRLEEIR